MQKYQDTDEARLSAFNCPDNLVPHALKHHQKDLIFPFLLIETEHTSPH